jgi:hypothetical protein
MRIKINPDASMKEKSAILLVVMMLVSVSTVAATLIVTAEEYESSTSPSEWLCRNNIYGASDLKNKKYHIYFQDMSDDWLDGLKITTAGNTSNSMAPTINHNNRIISIGNPNWTDIKIGDIIIFSHNDDRIVHRVIHKTEEYLKTKGDNNAMPDSWKVTPDDVISIVVGVIY